MDNEQYRKLNESYDRRLIYHVGQSCGFFVELNYMLDAMLYALAHGRQFQIYSEDANFGTGCGWTEYFLPFCTEVHESLHRQNNFHRPPTWRHILHCALTERRPQLIAWRMKLAMLTLAGHAKAYMAYGHHVMLGQDVPAQHEAHYHIAELGIDGDYYHAYSQLAQMIWHFQPHIIHLQSVAMQSLNMPPRYAGIHIRGGDKATEALLIDGCTMVERLATCDGDNIFVLTDDIRLLDDVRRNYPSLHFFSLCQPTDTGYNHQSFCHSDPHTKQAAITRLLLSVDILLRSHTFVGSITTGPSVFIMKVRHNDHTTKAIDCPTTLLPSALCQAIDIRSEISRQTMCCAQIDNMTSTPYRQYNKKSRR